MAVNKDTRKIKEAGEYTTSPARRKANNRFAKQNYETVGYKCKKGIKSILEIIVKNTGEKSVSKLVEKAVIEYVKNLEHGTNVLASAEEDLLLLKDILKYDNENRCLYPLDHLDYLEDLCYMYYENRKDKKDFEFSPILIDFLKPNKMNDEIINYISFEDYNTKGLKGAKMVKVLIKKIHGVYMHTIKVYIQRKKMKQKRNKILLNYS